MPEQEIDKYGLIYEFNPNSPLFAKVAYNQLQKGYVDKALEILEKGLNEYPDYITAIIIYSQALAQSGNIEKAKEELSRGFKKIDFDESYNFYLKKLEEIHSQNLPFAESRRISFLSDETPGNENKQENFENNLENLAKELSSAKIDLSEETQDSEDSMLNKEEPEILPENKDNNEDLKEKFKNKNIISETLAVIYYAQGSLREAKYIYERLLEKHPEKADLYKSKISEINAKLTKFDNS